MEPSESITISENKFPSEMYNLTTANIIDSTQSKYNLANANDNKVNGDDGEIFNM